MSDDPFAAFSSDASKKGARKDDPFSIFDASSSSGTDPFASLGTSTVSSASKSQDAFNAFGLPPKEIVGNDPFAAFTPVTGVDPFAAPNISSDPFGLIATATIDKPVPPMIDPFLMEPGVPAIQPKPASVSFQPAAVVPNKGIFPSPRIESDPFSMIDANPDPFAGIPPSNTASSAGGIYASKSVDSSMDRPADVTLQSSPVVRQRASFGASSDTATVSERIDPPPIPEEGPGQLNRLTPPMSPPQAKLTKPPPPPKAEKPAKILASNFTSKPSPSPAVGKSIFRAAPAPDVVESDPENSPQLPKKTRQVMRPSAYSGPKTYSSDKGSGPFWRQHAFFDIFIGMPRSQFLSNDPDSDLHPVRRIRSICHVFHETMTSQISCFSSSLVPNVPAITKSILMALYEATMLLDLFPYSMDPASIYAFLNHFIVRLRGMRSSDFLLFPCTWTAENESYASIVVVYRAKDDMEADFTVAFVNCESGSGGLDYHASKADPRNGNVLRNLALEVTDVENTKILSPAFW